MHSACTTALPGEAELRAAWQLLEQLYQSSARFSPPEQFARVVAREMKVAHTGCRCTYYGHTYHHAALAKKLT